MKKSTVALIIIIIVLVAALGGLTAFYFIDKNKDDALAVVSVILNRCDDSNWRSWAGDTPYKQHLP